MSAIIVRDWQPMLKGALLGWITVEMPSGLILHGCGMFRSDGKAWASPPSKPIRGRDGTVLLDAKGKPRYEPVVSFASKALADQFSALLVEALRQHDPDALTGVVTP